MRLLASITQERENELDSFSFRPKLFKPPSTVIPRYRNSVKAGENQSPEISAVVSNEAELSIDTEASSSTILTVGSRTEGESGSQSFNSFCRDDKEEPLASCTTHEVERIVSPLSQRRGISLAMVQLPSEDGVDAPAINKNIISLPYSTSPDCKSMPLLESVSFKTEDVVSPISQRRGTTPVTVELPIEEGVEASSMTSTIASCLHHHIPSPRSTRSSKSVTFDESCIEMNRSPPRSPTHFSFVTGSSPDPDSPRRRGALLNMFEEAKIIQRVSPDLVIIYETPNERYKVAEYNGFRGDDVEHCSSPDSFRSPTSRKTFGCTAAITPSFKTRPRSTGDPNINTKNMKLSAIIESFRK